MSSKDETVDRSEVESTDDRRSFLRDAATVGGGLVAAGVAAQAAPALRRPRIEINTRLRRPSGILQLQGPVKLAKPGVATGSGPEPVSFRAGPAVPGPSSRQRLLDAVLRSRDGSTLMRRMGVTKSTDKSDDVEALGEDDDWALAYADGITLTTTGRQFVGHRPRTRPRFSYLSLWAQTQPSDVGLQKVFVHNRYSEDVFHPNMLECMLKTPGTRDDVLAYMIEINYQIVSAEPHPDVWLTINGTAVDTVTTGDDTQMVLVELPGNRNSESPHWLSLRAESHEAVGVVVVQFHWMSVIAV